MSLQDTPRSNRLHIGIFGKRNTGKSSLINALTNQAIALVSDIAGTTTDPVYKSMEINGIGPCVFIDTPGFDDVGEIGMLRISQTEKAIEKTDIALVLFCDLVSEDEVKWIEGLKEKHIPIIAIINKRDLLLNIEEIEKTIMEKCKLTPILVSALNKSGITAIREELIRSLPVDYESKSITSDLANSGDLVLLVMPQDIQAPKGRLILPQVQVIRELLDKKSIVMSITTDMLDSALEALKNPPRLIITDSQVFKTVYEKKPQESMLTSFSVLMAGNKGDLSYFTESAKAISSLTETSRVLIAEACTHAPLTEDIGREKIPRFLKEKIGLGLTVDILSGTDFPEDISSYDLIIHCGACMFNRKYMLSRIEKAKSANVPMTNYGVTLAYLSGILDKIDLPK
ncbi:MAG: hydF [Clostridiales bacterium]|jgi:[FeFe] hydrogenase H-cluster maturation GTPase HydF|nr:hydF [Clostridiales bacterium]